MINIIHHKKRVISQGKYPREYTDASKVIMEKYNFG